MRRKLIVSLSLSAGLTALAARGSDLHVPGSFPTIQAAVDASSTGDWVLVAPGVYTGAGNRDIDPSGRSIRIIGTSGAEATILDCEGSPSEPHRGFIISSGDASLIIEGVTIRNGYAQFGGGIHILGSGAPRVRHVVVENCSAEIGGGVLIASGEGAAFVSCAIQGNVADSGGGLEVRGGAATIEDCMITDNTAGSFGGGIRIQPGRASVLRCVISSNTAFLGAGAWCYDAEPIFTDCTISGNIAQADGGGAFVTGGGQFINCRITSNAAAGESGGLRFQDDSSAARAENCIINENVCGSKGALTMTGGAAPSIANCDISWNTNTGWGGGGVHCEIGADPTIAGCRISGNSSMGSSGGLYAVYDSSPRIDGCLFEGNLSHNAGGGVALEGGQGLVSNCVIRNNVAEGETGGLRLTHHNQSLIRDTIVEGNLSGSFGAVTIRYDCAPRIVRCAIENNITVGYGAGGVHCENNADILVEGCIIRSNLSEASVLSNIDSDVLLINSLVVDNHNPGGAIQLVNNSTISIINSTVARNVGEYNGGVTQFDGELTVTNSIVWDNSGPELMVYGGTTTVSYSDIEGGWAGVANLDIDPRFENAARGDYRLASGSPCIDAADNNAVPADFLDLDGDGDFAEPIPFDLADQQRFMDDPLTVDTGNGTPPLVDMGAYEFEPGCEGKRGDWDEDCDVDLGDHAIIAGCLTGPGAAPLEGCELTDLDGDGDVDLGDVAVFQTLFGH